jgi:hypothetical protein
MTLLITSLLLLLLLLILTLFLTTLLKMKILTALNTGDITYNGLYLEMTLIITLNNMYIAFINVIFKVIISKVFIIIVVGSKLEPSDGSSEKANRTKY